MKRASIHATLPLIFKSIDADHDNGISPGEFQNYFVSMGVTDEKFSQQVFKDMDFDSDGQISNEGE